MSLLVQLSDLHMTSRSASQAKLFEQLVQTLRREREARRDEHVAVVVTGDVFDSVTQEPSLAIDAFLRLHGRIVDALGGDAPTIVLPGNHDRRRFGLIGPHRRELFDTLRDAVDSTRVYVAGCDTPFLAQIVPDAMHGLPAHVIAYDSTYLPHGLVGAGGTIRLEDLLLMHARLPNDGRPLLVLIHHHLVPTPLTDISDIDSVGAPRIARWILGTALPALISNGDREELTMTALGAGTALSTLHTFGRAVLLLHGHKHVPTARLVAGMTSECGDVLIASAGSAGTRERVHAARHPDAARLWPSLNVIEITDEKVRIESLSFSPKQSVRPPMRRELANVDRAGRKWSLKPMSFRVRDVPPRVNEDEAIYTLTRSMSSPERWDFSCERRVELAEGARLRRYIDFAHALPRILGARGGRRRANRRIEIRVGDVTRYHVEDALSRTLEEGARSYGAGTAFEWVGLLCRYGAARATLRLSRADADDIEPFGSVTDLTTGRERPATVATAGDHWVLCAEPCAPRSLLRIYWPLASNAALTTSRNAVTRAGT
jgi:3',5'-cyclic AMP phosphodiesterase CpdA